MKNKIIIGYILITPFMGVLFFFFIILPFIAVTYKFFGWFSNQHFFIVLGWLFLSLEIVMFFLWLTDLGINLLDKEEKEKKQ